MFSFPTSMCLRVAGSYGNHFPLRPSQAFPQGARHFCPSLGFVAAINTVTKCNLWEGKLDFSYGRPRGQPVQEARGRNYSTDRGEHCWGACSQAHLPSSFLRQHRPTCLGMILPALGCSLQHQLATKKNAPEIFPKACLIEAAPQERVLPSSHVSLICVRLPDDTNYENFACPQCIRVWTSHHPHQYLLPTVLFWPFLWWWYSISLWIWFAFL